MGFLLELRIRMIIAITILFSTVFSFFYLISWLIGLNTLFFPIIFATSIVLIQWFLSPLIIKAIFKINWLNSREENPLLWDLVQKRAKEANVTVDKIGISEFKMPNAFVYGIFGSNLVVTDSLLSALQNDNEALDGVLSHEIGHLRHSDMKLMLLIGTLPSIFYMIAYAFMLKSGSDRDSSYLIIIGFLSYILYMILNLGVLLISRYREYYADAYSKQVNGPTGLVRGLAKITYSNRQLGGKNAYSSSLISLKALLIVEPEKTDLNNIYKLVMNYTADNNAIRDVIIQKMQEEKKLTILEIFSTHPLTINRIIKLLEL